VWNIVYVCLCVYMCVCACIYINLCVHVRVYACVRVCAFVFVYMYVCVRACVRMCAWVRFYGVQAHECVRTSTTNTRVAYFLLCFDSTCIWLALPHGGMLLCSNSLFLTCCLYLCKKASVDSTHRSVHAMDAGQQYQRWGAIRASNKHQLAAQTTVILLAPCVVMGWRCVHRISISLQHTSQSTLHLYVSCAVFPTVLAPMKGRVVVVDVQSCYNGCLGGMHALSLTRCVCVCACVRACVRACVSACVCVCVCVCV